MGRLASGRDNFDGTYTQLDDDYYVLPPDVVPGPLSYGFITGRKCPTSLCCGIWFRPGTMPTVIPSSRPIGEDHHSGRDCGGGATLCPAWTNRKKLHTGIVVVVEHGAKPSRALMERGPNGYAKGGSDYWATTTGHRLVHDGRIHSPTRPQPKP